MAGFTHILWARCRIVAAALIAGLWPGREVGEVAAWIERAEPARQRAVVLGALGGLLAASLLAASFGLLGLCVFWLAVIWLVR